MAWIYFIAGLGVIALAMLFVALGIKIANTYNDLAWRRYYEGIEQAGGIPVKGAAVSRRKPA